jgi:hypothetical protein
MSIKCKCMHAWILHITDGSKNQNTLDNTYSGEATVGRRGSISDTRHFYRMLYRMQRSGMRLLLLLSWVMGCNSNYLFIK